MSRSLRREAGAPVSSSSSDASEDDLLQTTRERGTLRELLLSKSTSAGGAVGRETGETPPLTARLTEPLERSVERAPRGKQDTAEDTAGTTTGPTKMNAEGSFSASPSPSMRAPANSASGTPSAAPTPSRFSSSLAAQKRMHHDLLSEAARRRLEVKLQVVEELLELEPECKWPLATAAHLKQSIGGDEARSRLHAYLHALFERDPTAGAELHGPIGQLQRLQQRLRVTQ